MKEQWLYHVDTSNEHWQCNVDARKIGRYYADAGNKIS